jgi:glycosyltransferase 2 family protein
MKKIKINSLIVGIITIIVLIIILKDNYYAVMDSLRGANIGWLLMAIFFFLLYFFFDQLSIFYIVKEYNKKITFKFILYLGTITKFFNGITPLASGGQPMQVYEMHKKGISVTDGANIVIQNYICFQISLVILGVLSYIANKSFNLFRYDPLLKNLTIVGFVINGIVLLFLMLISFSPDFNKTLVKGFINLLAKLKIVKHKEKQLTKWDKICKDYYDNAQILFKHYKTFIFCTFNETLSLLTYYAIPYFIAYAVGLGNNITFLETLVAGSYIYIMGCYVPIPGASGGMEYGFLGFFSNFIEGPSLSAMMVLWRFITYYLPVIIGAVIFNVGPGKDVKEQIKEGNL